MHFLQDRALTCSSSINTQLYSKSDNPPDPQALRPYYESLIDKYIIGGRDALLEW